MSFAAKGYRATGTQLTFIDTHNVHNGWSALAQTAKEAKGVVQSIVLWIQVAHGGWWRRGLLRVYPHTVKATDCRSLSPGSL